VAERIDPTSVHIKFKGTVIEQNYQYDLVSLAKILEKYIDNDITLTSDKNTIKGKLLSTGNIVLRKEDGSLLMLPKIDDYQIAVGALPEGLITKPTLVWTLESDASGKQDVEITYQTTGLNWHTEYVALLNENDTKMDLKAWVSINNNTGATYKNAVLKLVAGMLTVFNVSFLRLSCIKMQLQVLQIEKSNSRKNLFLSIIFTIYKDRQQ